MSGDFPGLLSGGDRVGRPAPVLALIGVFHEVCYVCPGRVVRGQVGGDEEERGVVR